MFEFAFDIAFDTADQTRVSVRWPLKRVSFSWTSALLLFWS